MGIEEKIRELPPDLHKEVEDYVDYLLHRAKKKTGKKLKLDWAGSLKEYRDAYTSVELQHKILETREQLLKMQEEGPHYLGFRG